MIKLYSGRSGYRAGNAGDEVSAPLLRALLGRPVQVMAEPENAEIFAAGSILDKLPSSSTAIVWGSGLIREDQRVDCPGARVLALRGPLTAARFPGAGNVVLGDPGILVSRIWPMSELQRRFKRFRLGIVPHYADEHDERVTRFARRWQEEVTVIDICGHVESVCRQIADCWYILSSSLHGLIFADSYGIPNGRLILSDGIAGGSFKFRDYLSTFLLPADPRNVAFDGSETVAELVSRIESWWTPRMDIFANDLVAVLMETYD